MTIPSTHILHPLTFCIIDLETTGGNHKHDKIIEVGLVKVQNLEILDDLSFLIKPEIHIPDFIQKLTSITPDQLTDAPIIDDVIDQVVDFIGDSILVAHNASFDVPFLNSVLKRLQKPLLKNRTLCTHLMSKYLVPNILNSNLNYMSRIFGIDHSKAHRALEDATATAHLLNRFLTIFMGKGISKINHLYYPRNKYELDRIHFHKKDAKTEDMVQCLDMLQSPVLVTFKGEKGVLLNSIPIEDPKKQLETIKSLMQELPWQMMTIRLYGSVIEAILDMAVNFTKFPAEGQKYLLQFLTSQYLLPNTELIEPDVSSKGHRSLSKELPQFMVINHLIPEQMIIYPLINIGAKSEMIFRFPGHQKKIFQYIKNQHKRFKLTFKEKKRASLAKDLMPFINTYLIQKETEQTSQFFFFNVDKNLKTHEDFAEMINKFLAQNPNTYDYPNHHI